MNGSPRVPRLARTPGPLGPPPPVRPGDHILLVSTTARETSPTPGVVEFVDWVLAEEILRGNAQSLPWRVHYRLSGDTTGDHPDGSPDGSLDGRPSVHPDENATETVGVIDLDDHGYGADTRVITVEERRP